MADFGSKCRKEILSIKPYIPGKPIEEVKREFGISDVVKLASNENPLGSSPEAITAVKKAIDSIYMYPDGSCNNLKQDISNIFNINCDSILIGNGSDEIIKLLAEAFVDTGDEVIIPDPSFAEYEFATKVMGGKCVYSPLKNYRIDLDDVLDRITAQTKVIFLCNPNNPTGTIVYENEVKSFFENVPNDVLVVFDEAYYEYVTSSSFPETLDLIKEGMNNLIVLRTFSKIYGLAGLRVGYGISSKEIVSLINRVREPFNVNMLAQEAARAALYDSRHLENSRICNEEGKDFLYKEFNKLGLKYYTTEANFLWVDLEQDCNELFKEMLKRGIIIRTGDIFGCDTFARITIGTQSQNEKLISVLKALL